MKKIKAITCMIAIGLIIFVQMISPLAAYADGETPPPSTDAPQVTSPPLPNDTPEVTVAPLQTEEPEATSTPLPGDAPTDSASTTEAPTLDTAATDLPAATLSASPSADAADSPTVAAVETASPSLTTDTPHPPTEAVDSAAQADSTTEVAPTDSPTPDVSTATPDAASAATDPTLLETVQSVSSDTSVVVLDANGQPLPLASQAAADAIAASDPMWCPTGQTPGGAGCTISYPTVTQLISNLGTKSGAGTVYFTPVYSTADATFDHNDANLSNLTDLTIQGGWNGSTGGAYALSGNSTFSVPILVLNWNGSVTINNVTVEGASGAGIGISTNSRNVTIKNSSFSNTVSDFSKPYPFVYGDGADIFTNGGNVTITNSQFNNNEINGGYGAWISAGYTGNITVTNSQFNNNSEGLDAFSSNNISILGGSQFQNNFIGVGYFDCKGSFVLDPATAFLGNVIDIYNGSGCSSPIPPPASPLLAPIIIPIQGAGNFSLNCPPGVEGTYRKSLPNGDLVEINCPVLGTGSIVRRDSTTLPANLPDGYTYASAFDVEIKKNDQPIQVIEEGGNIRASFVASNLQPGNSFDILYWDAWKIEDGKWVPSENPQWVPLKDFMRNGNAPRSFYIDPDTGNIVRRKIDRGVQLVDQRVQVTVNFPGIFVLAQH